MKNLEERLALLGIGYEQSKGTITCNSPRAKELLGDLHEATIPVPNARYKACQDHSLELLDSVMKSVGLLKEWINNNNTGEEVKDIFISQIMLVAKITDLSSSAISTLVEEWS